MSFGFGVGDFIAVAQIASKIRKDFVGAPGEFKAISDEVRSLSIVLQDIEVVLSDRELRNEQEADLKQIAYGCSNVLKELETALGQYGELKSGGGRASERVKRVWKRLKWEPEDVQELRSRISANVGLLNAFTSRLTRDNVDILVRGQEDRERQTILDWITPIDYALQQSDFINRRQAGTGQWLLSSAEFKTWLEGDRQTLYSPGIPGSGKTILTAVVVEELLSLFENDGEIGIAYLYCNYQRQNEQNLVDLFASLLKQLVQEQPAIPDTVKMLYDRHNNKRTRPSPDEILQALQTVAATYSRVFVIVDALDECQISDGCRQRLLSGLFNLQENCNTNLFATSRPISSIEIEFEGSLKLEIRASQEDMRRYLEGHIFRLPGFVARNPKLQEEVITEIIKAVDGMFLLAQLHLESLAGKKSPKVVRAALRGLATGSRAYDHAYEDAMERINSQVKDQVELAKQVLSWITCAKRQLTTIELQHALAIEVGESELDEENFSQIEDIVSVCAGLVTIDDESGIVRLVHYTTREYFERTQSQWFPDAQIDITISCISYLSFDQFKSGACQNDEELEQRLQSNKLYDYAAHNWGHHAREASVLIPAVVEFLERRPQLEASTQVLLAKKTYSEDLGYSQRYPKNMTGLHLAAYFGVATLVKPLFDKSAKLEEKPTDRSTPLHWASGNGHLKVVKLLLENGANPEVIDSNGCTSLYLACRNEEVEVVKLLLENGADLAVADSTEWTPLLLASAKGYIEIVKILLENGANPAVANGEGWTPLLSASGEGYIEIAKLLLENGANPAVADFSGWKPLHAACSNGHVEVVKLLLENGASPEVTNFENWTPLHGASINGHVQVVKFLLENGANPEVTDSTGWTPLHVACNYGHVKVVKLLLENGANPEVIDSNGYTSLYLACSNEEAEVVKVLLENGVDVEAKDNFHRTSLFYAAKDGKDAIVKLLLDTGRADIDSKDYYCSTSLSIAARMGHADVVAFLFTKSPALNVKDTCGRTPLWWTRRTGNSEIEKLLLRKYEEARIDVQEDELPAATSSSSANGSYQECDVCVLDIWDGESFYQCSDCKDGAFSICLECFEMKAHCLDKSHILIRN